MSDPITAMLGTVAGIVAKSAFDYLKARLTVGAGADATADETALKFQKQLLSRIETLEKNGAAREAEHEAYVRELLGERAELKVGIAQRDAVIATMTQRLGELKAEQDELKTEYADLKTEHRRLSEQLQNYIASVPK